MSFLTDEAALVAAAWIYHSSSFFSPATVTQFINQAEYAWAQYIPHVKMRTEWAIPNESPDYVAIRFKWLTFFDQFDADLLLSAATSIYNLRQWDDAIELLDRGIRDFPHRIEFRWKRLYAQRAKTGQQIARADIEKLASDFGDHPQCDNLALELYYSANLTSPAASLAYRMLARNPGDKRAFEILVGILHSQGRLDECDSLYPDYVAQHRDLAGNSALLSAATYYYSRREYDRAARFLSGKWRGGLDPWQGGTIIMLGKLKWASGDYAGAREEFERYFERYQGGAGPFAIANLEALRGNWEEMPKQADRILANRQSALDGWLLRAFYHLHKGRLVEGEQAVATGRNIMAHKPEAFRNLALWRLCAGDFPSVIQACEEGRRYVEGPLDTTLDFRDFRARLLVGDLAGAKTVLDRMMLFQPSDMFTVICEALWHLSQNDIASARRAIDVALRWNPKNTYVQTAHGRVLLAEGKKDEAIAELRFAADNLHFVWEGIDVYYYLGRALEAAGQTDEARKAYNRLLALWPVGYWAAQAKTALKKR
ncbi:tetratricopeptide repeat protein [Candidatus Sumerlaeota bacterium]|nr:tetratricopeptide repeat protein [Candidatus Sumerlaeota bacterium]